MEDFVPFIIAKKLKEKGFREDCIAKVNLDNTITFNHVFDNDIRTVLKCHNKLNPYIDAPTISQVLKWLREEKKLHIEIYMYHNCYLWEIYNTNIYDADFTQKSEKYSEIEYETYEQAALAGIEYVLENII